MNKTVRIPLSRGLFATIDAEDLSLVSIYKWHAISRGENWYAATNIRLSGGTRTILLMHRMLMAVSGREIEVDHRDCDGLNNKRDNLRVCSHSENQRNKRRRKDNRTGMKGVAYNKRHGKFYARIFINSRFVYLGAFDTAESAHRAYRSAALKHFGDFARPE